MIYPFKCHSFLTYKLSYPLGLFQLSSLCMTNFTCFTEKAFTSKKTHSPVNSTTNQQRCRAAAVKTIIVISVPFYSTVHLIPQNRIASSLHCILSTFLAHTHHHQHSHIWDFSGVCFDVGLEDLTRCLRSVTVVSTLSFSFKDHNHGDWIQKIKLMTNQVLMMHSLAYLASEGAALMSKQEEETVIFSSMKVSYGWLYMALLVYTAKILHFWLQLAFT